MLYEVLNLSLANQKADTTRSAFQLPHTNEFRVLAEAGVRIGFYFGDVKPDQRVIAVGRQVPLKNLQMVIEAIGSRFDFLHLSLTHPDRIILGAYSYMAADIGGARLDHVLRDRLVKGQISQPELTALLGKGA